MSPPFSIRRVGLIARNTIREAVRQRLFNFIALLAVGFVVGAQWLCELNFGASELKFIADIGFGAIGFFGSALTIIATGQLFFSEIEHRTVFTLLAKPLQRSEFIMGKWVGIAFVPACFCAVLTLLLILVLWSRETMLMNDSPGAFTHGRAVGYLAVLAGGFAQWLKLGLLAVLTLLVASFARTQLFTTATGFMFLLMGHLNFLAEAAGQRGGISAAIANLTTLALPNFQLFDFSEALGAGDLIPWGQLGRITVYATGYGGAVLGLAVFAFRRREL